jgi:hypothetical protein
MPARRDALLQDFVEDRAMQRRPGQRGKNAEHRWLRSDQRRNPYFAEILRYQHAFIRAEKSLEGSFLKKKDRALSVLKRIGVLGQDLGSIDAAAGSNCGL